MTGKFLKKAEKRVVAYLDILGVSTTQEFDSLIDIIDLVTTYNHDGFIKKSSKQKPSHIENIFEGTVSFSSFSDSIVISMPRFSCNRSYGGMHYSSWDGSILIKEECYLRENGKVKENDNIYILNSFIVISQLITDIILKCLERGYLIRGAFSYGQVYHTQNKVIGSPISEVVYAEQNLAKVPRILLCKSLVDKTPAAILSHFAIRDEDGMWYLDWAKSAINGHIDNEYIFNYDKIAGIIKNNLSNLTDNYNYYSKWFWIASYLNRSIHEEISFRNEVNKEINEPAIKFSLIELLD